MNELKDKDLREALRRREARRTKPEVPANFCDSIMQEITPKKSRPIFWRWVAVAACMAFIVGIGVKVLIPERPTQPEKKITAMVKEPATVVTVSSDTSTHVPRTPRPTYLEPFDPRSSNPSTHVARNEQPLSKQSGERKQETIDRIRETVSVTPFSDPNLHYAAIKTTVDSTYQAPSRMDEFIAKMADYNEVKAVPLDCAYGSSDSIAVSTAYVFEDKQELDLFGRLLQAACWYDSKTPGYLLNFSHQQFFFTLKDLHKNEKYLWIAERIVGGRILLFSTHSPIEAEVSSGCYQNYREQLTHTNFSTLHF